MSRKLLCAVGVSALLIAAPLGAALAADMAVKAPPPAPVSTWTGFYAGVNAGVGWTTEIYTTAPGGTLITLPFDGSLGWFQNLSGSSTAGFTGGGQAGYSQQVNNWVWGVETDIQYYGAKAGNSSVFTSTVPPGTGTLTNSISSDTPWFGTARLRLGTTVVSPNLLLYVTGGFAYGRENVSGLVSVTSGGALIETFPFGLSKTSGGYAVGGGGEWKFSGMWSLKAEYLHVELGNGQSQTVATTTLGPGALATDVLTLASSRDRLNIVRFGLNYKFGGPILTK